MFNSGAFGYLADYLLWWFIYASLVVHTWCFLRFFSRKRHKLRLIVGNGLIFACIFGIVALAAETHLRFAAVWTDSFGVSLPATRWFALHTALNTQGCRDDEWSVEKDSDTRRIAFVGDSFAYGWGIERVEDRFSDRVQAKFNRSNSGAVEVFNVAKPGWGTNDQLEPIEDMIAGYDVDEIVLCYVANDIEEDLPTTKEFNPLLPPMSTFFNSSSSCLLDYLYQRLIFPRIATVRGYHDWLADGFMDPKLWDQYQRRRLGPIIRACREADVTLRVVLLPFMVTGGENFDEASIHAKVSAFFRLNDIEVLDLLPAIRRRSTQELVVNRYDPHPGELAHEIFADEIWAAFYEQSTSAPAGEP